jgi:hypothetical protein
LNVNVPPHKVNVTIERHTLAPFALSASENAFIEEQNAKERDVKKQIQAEEFHNSTRMMLLAKMQDIERDKKKANFETVRTQ